VTLGVAVVMIDPYDAFGGSQTRFRAGVAHDPAGTRRQALRYSNPML
jgi:hypothetical protein